jgi:thioredoxin 1
MKRKWLLAVAMLLACWTAVPVGAADGSPDDNIPAVPSPGMVTMLDLGAHKCIPCKMMAPIIAELQKEYAGRASIIFIDVWEHQEQARRFGIRGIPTQIFYDKAGKEMGRHMGFLDKPSIVETFEKLGVPKTGK